MYILLKNDSGFFSLFNLLAVTNMHLLVQYITKYVILRGIFVVPGFIKNLNEAVYKAQPPYVTHCLVLKCKIPNVQCIFFSHFRYCIKYSARVVYYSVVSNSKKNIILKFSESRWCADLLWFDISTGETAFCFIIKRRLKDLVTLRCWFYHKQVKYSNIND